jgi:type IV secretion system protein VirD4
MVSRQETARPLLTPGEVMQLAPADELVLVSGMHPIRAKKFRYYADPNFTCRVLPAPGLCDGLYPDRPKPRAHDWRGMVRGPHLSLVAATDAETQEAEDTEGGLQQQRHPGLPAETKPEVQPPLPNLDPTENDDSPDSGALDRLRSMSSIVRAHAVNKSDGRDDLLPSF